MSGSIGDIFKFQNFLGKDVLEKYKEDPERALLGINTPFESKAWGAVLGKDYEPTVDMFGGNTEKQANSATASGINTSPGEKMHDLARGITSLFAGGYGLGQLVNGMGIGGFGGAPSSGGYEVVGPGYSGGETGAFDMYGAQSSPTDSATIYDAYHPTPAYSRGLTWQDYGRLGSLGSNLMGGGQQQQQPMKPMLMNQQYYPEFQPVYPGTLEPFLKRK